MNLIKSGTILAAAASLLALGACNSAKNADPAAKGPAAATVNGTAISQRTVDAIAKQAAASGRPDTPETQEGDHRPAGAANGGRGRGGQEGPRQDARGCRTARRDEAVRAGQRLRPGLHQEQSGDRRHGEGRIRPHQGDGQRQPVQGAPHPGREGIRSQGHHRAAQEGPGGLFEARDGAIEGPGLQGPRAATSDGSIRAEWCRNSAPP